MEIRRAAFVVVVTISFVAAYFILLPDDRPLQQPTASDVYRSTEDWSPRTREVFLVEKVNEEWITIFRTENSLFLGKLQRGAFGEWGLVDDLGNEGTLSAEPWPPEKSDEVLSSASQAKNLSVYFGKIINPDIHGIRIEVDNKTYRPTILESGRHRFYYLRRVGNADPYTVEILR